ncbi:amidohydrolase [Bacillus sp. JJ1503]|uniref:amidohydrolase n=1 Tax=Bacillus sp. JJ1503 TaxID=3122956 RepID=UPI002FFD9170
MDTLLIKQARVETGFEYEGDRVCGTKTELMDLFIENGRVKEVSSSVHKDGVDVLNANGKLLMPSFRDMHIHLDKTYFTGPWKACNPAPKGIFSRIEEEQSLLPKQLPFVQERAEAIIDLLLTQGHTHIRTHCNIDPVIGLSNLEATVQAFKSFQGKLTYDIVAFPQHGLLRSGVTSLMREAMKYGATIVGGLDPATVDRNINQSLETMMDIAIEAGTGIDIHLHDPSSLGAFTINMLAEVTKHAKKEGQVTISHGIALADLEQQELIPVIETLLDTGIDITSTIPINRPTIPVPVLKSYGVSVSVGHDCLTDHWSPFGTGNTIEKLSILGERFRLIDEYSLNRTWGFASGSVTPLNELGEKVWPQVGDIANMILLDATCSAHAVARRAPVKTVLHQGTIVKNNA